MPMVEKTGYNEATQIPATPAFHAGSETRIQVVFPRNPHKKAQERKLHNFDE